VLRSLLRYLIPADRRGLLAWKIFGRRIDRDQWRSARVWQEYEDVIAKPWAELQRENANYARRIDATVQASTGHVLELGAGCGNMTRWLDASPLVTGIIAVEPFAPALERLRGLQLRKVVVRDQKVERLTFQSGEQFNTVLACELIEHLYPDEEKAMLVAIKPYCAAGARYVVSTPVGWMDDPFHVRGFSTDEFRSHLERWYGPVTNIDLSAGYSQVACGVLRQA